MEPRPWQRRLRERLRPPRRLRLLRAGAFIIVGTLALGFAALNTGNNLLYLLLGALLGTIALSGWLSEQALRGLSIERRVPRAATAGEAAHVLYRVYNRKTRLPSHGIEIRELQASAVTEAAAWAAEPAFVAALEPRASVRARGVLTPTTRGVYPLAGVVLATSFPFGLFRKERDIELAGRLVVWPRSDRPVRVPRPGGTRGARRHAALSAAPVKQRGEYRSMREYRAGDDPRDIHWRSTARRGALISREYDRDAAEEYWIVLDTTAPDARAAEAAVELTASLAVAAAARGDRFGLCAGPARLSPATGSMAAAHALDLLAAVTMEHGAHRVTEPNAPTRPEQCVLVTARPAVPGGWGDVFRVDR